ncbi:Wiskott-Aldrich syndrome protein family member 3 [Heterocephalus glaber]|uniref:Wiskott-Aldrich syndrome protein family member n=1 Tax=Heterocephalus glaber TaxID=10181 RepID=G5AMX5_HETGA|nr:Wiskott-Aldrich syndrome protein family member 3 [Heterocephalus glaber]
MPLVKRNIEPRHLCRGALPEGITSELECVTNSTLSAIIRQLSSLSKHAEDIFGELFNEANNFYIRADSLQDRIDRLAVKVTQLDSTVEEVSLQDINMKKAFKSSTIQDQQVVSKNSIPNPVADIYNQSDKPPPLNILTPYRDDKKDGLKFYTDPSYFFDLWKEKMLQDTEDKRKEKRRQKEQKRIDGATREVKKVRKARNRRQEWNMMAYDKELRPDHRFSQSVHHGASSEGSLSPDTSTAVREATVLNARDGTSICTFFAARSHIPNVSACFLQREKHKMNPNRNQQVHVRKVRTRKEEWERRKMGIEFMNDAKKLEQAGSTKEDRLPRGFVVLLSLDSQPQPVTPSYPTGDVPPHGAANQAPEHEYRPTSASSRHMALNRPQQPPPPPPPPPQAPEGSQASAPMAPADYGSLHNLPFLHQLAPRTRLLLTPPLLGSPPGPVSSLSSSPMHGPPVAEAKRPEPAQPPISDARSDLLAAIRMGIQLKKVQEQREQEAKREPVGNDVATILSRRIAVEYSDSDDDSEFDENDWSD